MKYLITYEDGHKLIDAYDDFNFSKSEFMLEDYKVVTFTYFLCEFKHFETPLKEDPKIKGYDMRGATFVFNKDGSLYKRFLMLPKFFNLNQVENTQYDVVKHKKIIGISEKEDGSLIAVMKLPNGSLFPKTIGSFDNEQTAGARKILNDNSYLKGFIIHCLDRGFTPLFEYVSWDNRIVLKYGSPELRFLGARNNITGDYLPSQEFSPWYKVTLSKSLKNTTLDELIEKSKTEENKEGWVVIFEDGQMIKIKTQWYIVKHKCRDNLDRENIVIEMILNETIDDAITEFNEPMFTEKIGNIQNIVNTYIVNKTLEIEKLYKEYKGDKREFAIKYNKHKDFHLTIQSIRQKNIKVVVIDYLLKRTKHLKKAREFIEKGAI